MGTYRTLGSECFLFDRACPKPLKRYIHEFILETSCDRKIAYCGSVLVSTDVLDYDAETEFVHPDLTGRDERIKKFFARSDCGLAQAGGMVTQRAYIKNDKGLVFRLSSFGWCRTHFNGSGSARVRLEYAAKISEIRALIVLQIVVTGNSAIDDGDANSLAAPSQL